MVESSRPSTNGATADGAIVKSRDQAGEGIRRIGIGLHAIPLAGLAQPEQRTQMRRMMHRHDFAAG